MEAMRRKREHLPEDHQYRDPKYDLAFTTPFMGLHEQSVDNNGRKYFKVRRLNYWSEEVS